MSERPLEGWREIEFGQLCQRIVNGGTPATDNPRFWNGRTPWVTGADFTSNGIGEIRRFVSDAGVRASATSIVKAGNLLVVTRTGVGKLAIAPFDIAISQDITGIYLDGDKAETAFIFYLLAKELLELKKLNQGTSINGIIRTDLERHHVRIPIAKTTQQKVAAILTSLDTAIEKTEALIEKHQQIKAGLMHDLFTRGVLPNGQLRASTASAPGLFQQSRVGPVPRDWAVTTLRACLSEGAANGIYKPAHLIGRGALLIGQTALTEERSVNPRLARRAIVTKEELQRFGVETADILMSRVFATIDGVGQPALVPELGEPAVFESNMMRLRIDPMVIRPRLMFEWLKADASRRHIGGHANASNQVSVNQSVLYPLPVPVPTVDEQDRMILRIGAADARAATDQSMLAKLRAKKLGLMQDLLTGKVPVKVADPEVVLV